MGSSHLSSSPPTPSPASYTHPFIHPSYPSGSQAPCTWCSGKCCRHGRSQGLCSMNSTKKTAGGLSLTKDTLPRAPMVCTAAIHTGILTLNPRPSKMYLYVHTLRKTENRRVHMQLGITLARGGRLASYGTLALDWPPMAVLG